MLLEKDYSIIRQCCLKAGVELVCTLIAHGKLPEGKEAADKIKEYSEYFEKWVLEARETDPFPVPSTAFVSEANLTEKPFARPRPVSHLADPLSTDVCPVCEGTMHLVPAGISRAGKAYKAFWGCDKRNCSGTRNAKYETNAAPF